MGYQKLGIIALVLVLGIGVLVFYLASSNSKLPLVAENSSSNSNPQLTPKLNFVSPFEAIKNSVVGSIQQKNNDNDKTLLSSTQNPNSTSLTDDELNKIIENFNNFFTKQNFTGSTLSSNQTLASDIPQIPLSELNIQDSGAKTTEEYYKKLLETVSKLGFSKEDSLKIKKENIGENKERPLLLEELIEKVNAGDNLNELRDSFIAWHSFDETVITELKKIPVNLQMVFNQQMFIGWFKYHSQTAEKFSEGNLSKEQISQLADNFKKNADIHMADFQKSVLSLKESPEFVFIPKAEAFTCGVFVPPPFYHFGGRVILMEPCNFGIVETISPPCGGLILFSYAALAANPYLYKKPTIGSVVLGRSTVAAGVCPLGGCPGCILFPYEAVVLYFPVSYFGTSGLP